MSCRLDYDDVPAEIAGPTEDFTVRQSIEADSVRSGRKARRFSGRAMLVSGLAVVVGLAAIGSLQDRQPGSNSALASASAKTSEPTDGRPPTPEPTFWPTGQITEATVVRVVDGDTIVVSYGGTKYTVRYIGINSPAKADPNGTQATAANSALVKGKTVYLEKDVSEVDQFDRLLRYVWVTKGTVWTLVNLELIRQGFAAAKSYPPDIRYDDLYRVVEGDAQGSALGIWGVAPAAATPKPTPKLTPKPAPKPIAKPKPAPKCHPSYRPCLPIVGDLDCPDVRAMGKAPVDVIGPDDYRLDRDGDDIGCE